MMNNYRMNRFRIYEERIRRTGKFNMNTMKPTSIKAKIQENRHMLEESKKV